MTAGGKELERTLSENLLGTRGAEQFDRRGIEEGDLEVLNDQNAVRRPVHEVAKLLVVIVDGGSHGGFSL
jgi:hypothetical protein